MKKMKNKWTIFMVIVLVVGFGGFMLAGSENTTSNNNTNSNGEFQIVKLSVENGKYVMNPSELKVGVPVRLEADMSKMPGCSRSIVIASFNVRKTFTSTSNIIEFTPNKAGTFNIACSMNMYKGTFTVLGNDGSKSNYVEQAPTGGGSCGASGGGCGCGG